MFWCHLTARLDYRADLQWRVYARYSGGGERGRFCHQSDVCRELPPTATKFVALSQRGALYNIENTHEYEFFQPDEDPAKYDPTAEHFCRIEDVFEASIMS